MNRKYIFSFYQRHKETKLVRPKWFQFWKRSELQTLSCWTRAKITFEEKPSEATIDGIRLALKFFEPDVYGLQLEHSPETPYIPTESVQTNLLINSEKP